MINKKEIKAFIEKTTLHPNFYQLTL